MIRDCVETILQTAEWEHFREDNTYNAPLKIVDCWNQTMYWYPFECPIVRYQCDENSICALDGDPHLNSFVESITVSFVQRGKKFEHVSEKTHTKSVKADVVVYYTDHFGINHSFFRMISINYCWKKQIWWYHLKAFWYFYRQEKSLQH